ncbi:MAG: fumarylacetoacetate hydrolase family protein, partial [Trebonia sp.]
MKLATLREPLAGSTRAVRVDDAGLVDLGFPDVGALLTQPDWAELASRDGDRSDADGARFAALLPRPGKIVCVGLNYRGHILEMGRELPEYPTLFAKYAEALIGSTDDIWLAPESDAVDWEAELAVVIGRRVRRASESQAEAAIAGFSVLDGVTMRDWQNRTAMW